MTTVRDVLAGADPHRVMDILRSQYGSGFSEEDHMRALYIALGSDDRAYSEWGPDDDDPPSFVIVRPLKTLQGKQTEELDVAFQGQSGEIYAAEFIPWPIWMPLPVSVQAVDLGIDHLAAAILDEMTIISTDPDVIAEEFDKILETVDEIRAQYQKEDE